jgi:hypothetical protein
LDTKFALKKFLLSLRTSSAAVPVICWRVEQTDEAVALAMPWIVTMLNPCNYIISVMQASETELQSLFIETNVYSLVSHLYWAAWAIVQAIFKTHTIFFVPDASHGRLFP